MPKTLAEIAIEAGLVNKATAAKAGKLAEERKEPLIVTLIKELGVDEVALLAAFRKQTRVPLVDPKDIHIDPDALRQVPKDLCARLRVLPLGLTTDAGTKVLRVAMADPTDTTAIAELEAVSNCEIDIVALPLSAIDELVAKGYRSITTAVVGRPVGGSMFITSKGKIGSIEPESEVSVTAQIPISALQQAVGTDDLEARLTALVAVLTAKGLITEAELWEALKRGRNPSSGTT
ncbi:MAG: hypothetical protein IPQ07_30475 [Myxococcales bacterium]|nr:hypothetical protein [Myxococcales bacterium]